MKGDALAGHVADAEEELLVADVEVEEVAADFLGGRQRGVEQHAVLVVAGGELLGEHAHLDVAGNAQVALDGGLLGRGGLELLDVLDERLLHVAEGLAELSDLVDALELGQRGVELSGGDGLGFLGQSAQGLQLAGDDADEEVEHEEQSDDDDGHDGLAQAVEAAEDVALRTDDGHGAAGIAEGLVEHVAVLAVDVHVLDALLAALHGVAQGDLCGVFLLHATREDGLAGNLHGVGVDEVGTAAAYHDAVAVGVGLDAGDGL